MKKVVGIVINVILWLFVVFAALTTVVVFTGTSNNGVGNLFGYMPFSIQTQSMEPTIKAGDVVIGKEVDFNTLKEGQTKYQVWARQLISLKHRRDSLFALYCH